jgi:hypothetical protein
MADFYGARSSKGVVTVADLEPTPTPDLLWLCPAHGDRLQRFDGPTTTWVDVGGGQASAGRTGGPGIDATFQSGAIAAYGASQNSGGARSMALGADAAAGVNSVAIGPGAQADLNSTPSY